ncbi:MAG: dockerin type I domain-containing protein [Pirellulales bacterium]
MKRLWIAALALSAAMVGQAQALPILAKNDPIVAIWSTAAGANSTDSTPGALKAGQYPPSEAAKYAIDGSVGTKYLNFGNGGGEPVFSFVKGVGTGFYVTPVFGNSVATGFRFITGNDVPERDPTNITVEGSNATGDDLKLGVNWSLIYSGSSGLTADPGRHGSGKEVDFGNAARFTSYRVLVTSQRGLANSVQYSEFQLYGAAVLAGDVNGDGKVDLTDFGILKDNFGTGTSAAQGDLNGDAKVDLSDFGILKDNFGKGGAAAVPEPSGLMLCALGLLGLGLARRVSNRKPVE